MTGTILITGATSGFGFSTAKLFASHGWKVIGTGRRAERLDALKEELGASFHGMVFDITDETGMRAAFAALPAEFRNIDVLVNKPACVLGDEPTSFGRVWPPRVGNQEDGGPRRREKGAEPGNGTR